jgi:ADP-ribosylglycohydrolase
MADRLYSRVLGCMVGSTLGDAWGPVVEGASAERVGKLTGVAPLVSRAPLPSPSASSSP